MRTFFLVLALLTLLSPSALAQLVPRRGELESRYELVLENGQPFVLIHLTNRGRRPLALDYPAGLPLVGQREPSLPVALGRPVEAKLSPGQTVLLKVEALSLSLYPHHPGPYQIPPAPTDDDEHIQIARAVTKIWTLSRQGHLKNQATRLSRLAAYALSGQVPGEEVRSMASPAEWAELQSILLVEAPDPRVYRVTGGQATVGSRHEPNSKGNPFADGYWCSSRGGSDWLQNQLDAFHLVHEVRVELFSSDVTTDGMTIKIKAHTPTGWILVKELRNTNINKTALTGGAKANSVGPSVFTLSPPQRVDAVRLEIVGHGWFQAKNIQIWASGSPLPKL